MLEVSRLIRLARGEALSAPRAAARYGDRCGVPVVVWNVCRQCNMTCPHCYAAAGREPSSRRLSTAEGLHLVDDLAAGGVKHLIFSGGEPLLRDDLLELIAHARDAGVTPHLSTNGVFIDDDVAGRLSDCGVRYVGISIDGLASFNDTYRGLEHAFERAVRGLQAARDAGIKTGLRITVTRANVQHVAPMLARAAALSCDRFYVSHLVYAGRARKMQSDDLTPDESRRLLDDLFARADRCAGGIEVVTGGNDSAGPALVRWVVGQYGEAAAQRVLAELAARGGNSAGERILNIDHTGEVHPDQFWRGCSLGNVRTHSWQQILEHPIRAELADRENRLTGRCGRCEFKAVCRGSHRERSIAVGGGMFGPDPACLLQESELALSTQPVQGAA